MANTPKMKVTFGGCNVDHFSPQIDETVIKALNVYLKFEDALKLHLNLGQLLGTLNSYDRSTTSGKRSGANLCIHVEDQRVTVNQGKMKKT